MHSENTKINTSLDFDDKYRWNSGKRLILHTNCSNHLKVDPFANFSSTTAMDESTVEIESVMVSCASFCFASCEILTISKPHNLADLVNLITTDAALIRPIRPSLNTHWARILSCTSDDDFLTYLNRARPLVLSKLLPHFQYERSRVIYGSPYRKGP